MEKTHLGSFLDLENLERQIAEGFIARKKHPDAELYILNYTAAAQYTPGKMLDNEVQKCRGLIVDGDQHVVARPPAKFWNAAEHVAVTPEEQEDRKRRGLPPRYAPPPLPLHEPFEVYEKLDGSAGILYHLDGVPMIATRGSFISDQSKWATRFYQEHYRDVPVPEGQTYFFEVIYPENRIVVQYDFSGLVLLAVIENATGKDLPLPEWPGPVVKRYEFTSFEEISKMANTDPEGTENSEGFVIRFQSGTRCKVKFAEYCRLHKILTGVSTKTVYEHLGVKALRDTFTPKQIGLSLGMAVEAVEKIKKVPDPLADLVENVPDEFADWLRSTIVEYETAVEALRSEHLEAYRSLELDPADRKGAAAKIMAAGVDHSVLFKILDNRPYDDILWKRIRPEYVKAFAVDAEG